MKWKKLHEEKIELEGRSLLKKKFKLPNGVEQEFYIPDDGKTVSVLAFTPGKKIILTKQFRPGPEEVCMDMPGGYVDGNEKPEVAAARELEEETGYSGDLKFLGKNYTSAYSTEQIHNFLALNCKKVSGQELDKNEFLDIHLVSLEEFKNLLQKGKVVNPIAAYSGLHELELF